MPNLAWLAWGIALCGYLVLPAPASGSDGSTERTVAVGPEAATLPFERDADPAGRPAKVLTLEDALDLVLKQNPKLAAASREIRARGFETRQAGLLPNPELSVEVENVAGSGAFSGTDSAETTARLSQLFELGGKRQHRMVVARLEKEAAERQAETVRAAVLAEAAERFAAVLAAQERLELAAGQVDLTRKMLQTVTERIEAGKAATIEQIRFGSLVAEARLRQQQSRQELAASRRALALLWGAETADFSAVRGPFEEIGEVPEWEDLLPLLDASPAMALQQTALRRSDRALELERANGIPDLTLSLGVKNDQGEGDSALVAEFAVPLPLFDRNQGAVAAARLRRSQAADEARAAYLDLQAELLAAWRKLRSAYVQVEMLRETILPAARESFEGVTYGYRAGKFGFLEVLDAEHSLFEAKSRYVDALAAYHQAISETERLLGRKVSAEEDPGLPADMKRGQS